MNNKSKKLHFSLSLVFHLGMILSLVACAPSQNVSATRTPTSVEKTRQEATPSATQAGQSSSKLKTVGKPTPTSVSKIDITLEKEMPLRTLKNNVLEVVGILQAGDLVQIDKMSQTVSYNYRNKSGGVEFSSTGFYAHVKVIRTNLSSTDLQNLNNLSTGLYLSSVIHSQSEISSQNFTALIDRNPGIDYLKFFSENGKPKGVYTKSSTQRFPLINNGVAWQNQNQEERKKWSAIMRELQRVSDRTRPSSRELLIIDRTEAEAQSLEFENKGTVQTKGAWSIAVQGTAKRGGFENVPCAEFVSEVIRQAYRRAGYSHTQDFNQEKKNVLTKDNGASAVRFLSLFLYRAGWIAWDSQLYTPPTGAILMHANGISPGHVYISAGSSGRFIIDNSSPKGRDLRGTAEKTIEMMYQTGVFFLPPGFNPKKWSP